MSQREGGSRDLLLVEDNPGDARLVQEAFKQTNHANSLHVVATGSEALDFIYGKGDYADSPRPDVILLDWTLPKIDAVDVLDNIRTDEGFRRIPVIVLSGASTPKEIRSAYGHHANAFIEKPADPEEVERMLEYIDKFWFSVVRLPSPRESEE